MRGRPPRSGRALLGAALLAAAAGCGEPEPLRIGIVMSSSALSGARAAADEVNAGGGIRGVPLELVVLPQSATRAEPAIRGAERMAADPSVLAVVGHGNSAATLAASQVYNARGLVHVAPTSTATLLSHAGPYSFRMVPGDAEQAAFLAREGVRLARAESAAIVYENDDYGRGLHLDVTRELRARGVRIVAALPYMPAAGGDAMDFVPRRLAERRPEVVFWLGRYDRLAVFLRELHALMPQVLVLASEGVDSPELYGNPADFPALHFSRFVDAGSRAPCMERLRRRPDAETGGRSQDVLTYDAVLVIAEVLRGGARTREEVRRGLREVGRARAPVAGCAGPIRFDAAGDVERPYLLARVDARGVVVPVSEGR